MHQEGTSFIKETSLQITRKISKFKIEIIHGRLKS